jgi:hypothetical protein
MNRDTHIYKIFLLCNLVFVLTICAVFLWPLVVSNVRMSEVIRLQETRLSTLTRQQTTADENRQKYGHPAISLVLYKNMAETLAEISNTGKGLGLNEILFAASEPIKHETQGHVSPNDRVLFELTVSASYNGGLNELVDFTKKLDGALILGKHVAFREDNTALMRLQFLLFGIFE